jgi:hypothetical protein
MKKYTDNFVITEADLLTFSIKVVKLALEDTMTFIYSNSTDLAH